MRSPLGRVASSTIGAAAVVGAATLAYGVVIGRTRWTVRHEVLPVLEPGSRDLTLLHLSDLHMAPWQRGKQEFIRSLAVYEPDLVVDTGDNFGHVDALDGIRYALEPFRGAAGVFAHGSNDYYGPVLKNPFAYFDRTRSRTYRPKDLDTAGLDRYLTEQLGWLDLNNRAHALEIRGTRLELFGLADAHAGWARPDLLPGVVEELRENVEWSDDDAPTLSIGVTHAPYRRILDALVTQGANLIFAGHTHGGQVKIPGRPALVANCDIPLNQAQGLSVWAHGRASAFLEVSGGLGTSIYAPVRFGVPPEAVIVTLTAADIGYP